MAVLVIGGVSIRPESIIFFALCAVWLVLYLRRLIMDMRSAETVTGAARWKLLLPSVWEFLLWVTVAAAMLSLGDVLVSIRLADLPVMVLVCLLLSVPMLALGSFMPRLFLIGAPADSELRGKDDSAA